MSPHQEYGLVPCFSLQDFPLIFQFAGFVPSGSEARTGSPDGGLTNGFSALLAVLDTPQAPRGLAILTNSPYNAALLEVGLKALSSAQLRLSTASTRKKAS